MTLESGPEKIQAHIVKLSMMGMLVELDKVTFAVGAFLNAAFQLDSQVVYTERVRSIKHYDKFVRKVPKKLVEFHFVGLSQPTTAALSRFIADIEVRGKK